MNLPFNMNPPDFPLWVFNNNLLSNALTTYGMVGPYKDCLTVHAILDSIQFHQKLGTNSVFRPLYI